MKVKPIVPITEMRGSLTENYYCRVINGEVVVQHKPRRDKPPTEKQLAARRAFAERQKNKSCRYGEIRSGNVVVM